MASTARVRPPSGGLRGALTRALRGTAGIAVAMGVMNVATYGFQLLAARLLGPAAYGAIASLMALLLVVAVLQLGLQATAARRIASSPGQVAQIEDTILAVTYRSGLVLGAVLLILAPVVVRVLRLDGLLPAVLLALAAVPLTLMGGQAGILQGERRWGALAAVYLALGLPRLVLGGLFMWLSPTETSAMLAVALGLVAPAAVGRYALRHDRAAAAAHAEHETRPVFSEMLRNSSALLAFFMLSNLDIVIARNVLDAHNAGLYAGGLILTKAVLFLPQFVVVIAFPSLSTPEQRRRALLRSLTLVMALGLGASIMALVASDLAILFIGGDAYVDVQERLWLFALLGTFLSMLQLLVYSVLARQGRLSSYVVWAAVASVLLIGSQVTSLDQLLAVVILIDSGLCVALLGLSLWRMPRVAAAPPA